MLPSGIYTGTVAITFIDTDAAARAYSSLNGRWFDGSQLEASLLIPEPPIQTEREADIDAFLTSLREETITPLAAAAPVESTNDGGAVIQRGPILRIVKGINEKPTRAACIEEISIEAISKIEEETDDFLNSLL